MPSDWPLDRPSVAPAPTVTLAWARATPGTPALPPAVALSWRLKAWLSPWVSL
jgi:hypothetical protein